MTWDIAPDLTMVTQPWGETNFCGEWYAPWLPDAFCGDGEGRFHAGIDLGGAPGGNCGKPVYATRGGVVIAVGSNGEDDAGFSQYLGPNAICYRADDGMYLLHGHLSAAHVSVGQRLSPGQHIGDIGDLGASTACHLHLEARADGAYQGVANQAANVHDPSSYLNKLPAPAPTPAPPAQEDVMPRQTSLPVQPSGLLGPGQSAYVAVVVNANEDNAFLTVVGCDQGNATVDLIWTDAKTGAQDPGASKYGQQVSPSGQTAAPVTLEAGLFSGVRRGVIVNHGPGSVVPGCKVETK